MQTHILKRFVPSFTGDDKLDLLAHVVFDSSEESKRSDHFISHAPPTASRRPAEANAIHPKRFKWITDASRSRAYLNTRLSRTR